MPDMHAQAIADDLWNSFTPAGEAAVADRAAVADPRADGSEVDEIARFLATMLEYEYAIYRKTLRGAARKLLTEFGGSSDDLWDVMEARARDAHWLQGVIKRNVSPWLVVQDFIGDYARQIAQGHKREAARTEWQEIARRSQEYRGMDEAYFAELEKKYLVEKLQEAS